MAGADEARTAVEAAVSACGEVRTATAAARQVADDKRNEFSALGLEGIARVVQRAITALEAAHGSWDTAATACGTGSSALAGISDETDTSAALTEISSVRERLGEARTAAGAARSAQVSATTDSIHTEITRLGAAASRTLVATRSAIETIDAATRSIDEYRRRVEVALEAGRGQAGPATSRPPQSAIAGFEPKRLSTTAGDAIRKLGWPKDASGKLKARGHLYSDDGVNVMGRPLKALPYGRTYNTPDLKQPWRSDTDYTTTWHIEGGAAAWMRDTKTRSATLYLNAPTCGGDNRDPKRCYENVAKTLPQGATLTVWSVLENGETRRVRFRGTGEAIT
ncbi:MAG: DddA-like double-stranded DNA deaminase toxin [Stackebrandtia sp.]